MCQTLRIYWTFWYFRHLWPSDLVGFLMGLICIWIHWSTLKEFDGNSYLLTFKLSDECMRVVRATPGGYRKSWNCEGVYFGAFPPIVFNFPKSQIGLLIFSSWPGGPKCLKYQNVPYMHKFWHIGKPWGRFQCWVRRIYFMTVPDDHTVVWKCCNLKVR